MTLELTISNDAGVLGRICTLIGEQTANISDLRFIDRKPDYYRLLIDVDLRNVEHLHAVRLALEADSGVAAISRLRRRVPPPLRRRDVQAAQAAQLFRGGHGVDLSAGGMAACLALHQAPAPPPARPRDKIGRGIACGVFVCFTPFYGLHFLLSAGLAWIVRGNLLAALIGTFVSNPVTFPIIATISVELGSWMLGQHAVPLHHIVSSFSYASVEAWSNFAAIFTAEEMRWGRLSTFFATVFWPYLVGGCSRGWSRRRPPTTSAMP